MILKIGSRSGCGAAIGSALLLIAAPVQAQYSFTNIADTNTLDPGGGNFLSLLYPSINDNGTVAFVGNTNDFQGYGLIVGGTGGLHLVASLRTPPPVGSRYTAFSGRPNLNNAGVIGFQGFINDAGTVGEFTQSVSGASGVLIAPGQAAPGGGTLNVVTAQVSATLNNRNEGAFFANITGGSSNQGIFKSAAGTTSGSLTRIAQQGDAAPGTSGLTFTQLVDSPGINDVGQVCFLAGLSTSDSGIFVGDGTSITPIAVTGSLSPAGNPYTGFQGLVPPRINNNGRVVFDALHGPESLFSLGGGPGVSTIVTGGEAAEGGGTFTGFDGPNINDHGTVVFLAHIQDAASPIGIFTGGPGGLKKVIRIGEALFGSTVSDLEVSRYSLGLNDNDQVAFGYGLADGRSGIAVASLVTAAPEPQSLALLGIGLFLLGRCVVIRCPSGKSSCQR